MVEVTVISRVEGAEPKAEADNTCRDVDYTLFF